MRRTSQAEVTSLGRIIGDKVQSTDHVAHCLLPPIVGCSSSLFNISCRPLLAECCVLMFVCYMPNDQIVPLENLESWAACSCLHRNFALDFVPVCVRNLPCLFVHELYLLLPDP